MRENRILQLLSALVVFFQWGSGQVVDAFQAGTHSHNGTSLPYRLFVPANYDSSQSYPLVLFLHGAGERGVDNYKPVNDNPGAQLFAGDVHQSKHPSFVLAPQCPPAPEQWVDVPWSRGSYEQDQLPVSNELRTVVDLLDSLLVRYSLDSNRIYAVGSSMGGYGTWDIITRYPGKFSAAIPVVGAGDPSKVNAIQHMGIWAHHGTSDGVVPVTGTRNMMLALERLGSTPFFTHCDWDNCNGPAAEIVEDTLISDNPPRHLYSEYNGLGHELWSSAYSQFEGMADWLFSFSKKEPPIEVQHPKDTSPITISQTGNTLHIQSQNEMSVSLITIAGKETPLLTGKNKAIAIPMKSWRRGIYLIRVRSKGQSRLFKIFLA